MLALLENGTHHARILNLVPGLLMDEEGVTISDRRSPSAPPADGGRAFSVEGRSFLAGGTQTEFSTRYNS